MKMIIVFLLIAISGVSSIKEQYLDRIDEPVIGILTQPLSRFFKDKYEKRYMGYIASSYKKWVELTGARAIAIPHWESLSEIRKILKQINGLVLPGGATNLMIEGKPSRYLNKTKKILDIAYKHNPQKKKFPIWGTCLGFEILVDYFSGSKVKRIYVNTENTNERIKWTKHFKHSEFDKVFRKSISRALSTKRLTFFSHKYGFTIDNFLAVKSLRNQFNVIGYYRKHDMNIVAAIQHKKYPIIGVQFHPEKILFEHKAKVNIDLTKHSAMASQELSRVIFNTALNNRNSFTDQNLLEHLEFKSFNSKKSSSVFESIYLFNSYNFSPQNLDKEANLEKIG